MWRIAGHEWIVKLLQQSLAMGHLAHAYLFVGLPRVGKTTLAVALAQALNCRAAKVPCGECLSCQKIARWMHPDVRLVEAEPDTNAIKIEQIRELQREAVLSPFEGAWRVYVIPEFQKATAEAANCLLKTLEEPPPRVVLILTAPDTGALLPTIVSRCQVYKLRPLPLQQTSSALQRLCGASPEKADLLARLSEGRIGWAINACADEQILRTRAERLDMLRGLPHQSLAARFQKAQRLAEKPEELPEILDLWASWWRDVLLVQGKCEDLVVNVDRLLPLREDASRFTLAQVQVFLRAIQRTKSELEGNANARLATEVLLMDCPSPAYALRQVG